MLGPTALLASGRTGRQVATNRSDSPVFIDSSGKLLCRHGERSASCPTKLKRRPHSTSHTIHFMRMISTCITLHTHTGITAWQAAERKDPAFVRPSACDCGNIDGLMSVYTYDTDSLHEPALEQLSLYKLLERLGAEQRIINTRPQCKAITTKTSEVWVQPAGTLVCKHGNTRKVITKLTTGEAGSFKRKSSLVKCDCTLNIPRRTGSIFILRHKGLKGGSR